ncbi:hypothetical protein [Undibacterium terreum]|uniref:hypothetical protein n=1 Tax=Undibacterium terreum TaxID=1224302 RepID=UPI001668E9D3|nr:hypothetical protein [Undibacterium terreum]
MTSEYTWPDKREFASSFGGTTNEARVKNIREINIRERGIAARIYEFHHDFQSTQFVESRDQKQKANRTSKPDPILPVTEHTESDFNPTETVNLIARR